MYEFDLVPDSRFMTGLDTSCEYPDWTGLDWTGSTKMDPCPTPHDYIPHYRMTVSPHKLMTLLMVELGVPL